MDHHNNNIPQQHMNEKYDFSAPPPPQHQQQYNGYQAAPMQSFSNSGSAMETNGQSTGGGLYNQLASEAQLGQDTGYNQGGDAHYSQPQQMYQQAQQEQQYAMDHDRQPSNQQQQYGEQGQPQQQQQQQQQRFAQQQQQQYQPPQQEQKKSSVVIKVGMVGDAQIGKTSLMVKYVEGNWDEDYIQTLGQCVT
jgi:hypothetical protein